MDDKCPICLLILSSDVTITSCDHSFHAFCLAEWTTRRYSCPLCRTRFPSCEPQVIDTWSLPFVFLPRQFAPRLSVRMLRQQGEEEARRGFHNLASIAFTYGTFDELPHQVFWLIMAKGIEWMPQDWLTYFRANDNHETADALKALQEKNADVSIRSLGGQRPNNLYLCRWCELEVFGSSDHRQQHVICLHHVFE